MKRKVLTYKVLLVILALCTSLPMFAGDISIRAKLDSAYLLMGKQVAMHIEIVQDENVNGFLLLNEGDTITDKVEIAGWRKSDSTEVGNNRIQINKELMLQSFDSGLYVLPPVLYVSGKDTFKTNSLSLKVLPAQVDSLKSIHDYKPVQIPERKFFDFLPDFISDYWWIYLIVVSLIAAAVYLYIRKRQGKSIIPVLAPKKELLPPYDEAIKALDELKVASLWQKGMDKEYHTQLTEIIRRYIARRFEVNAMEMTSSQLLNLLNQDDAKNAKDELRTILETADFVKFAKMRPLADENEESFRLSMEFLNKTKPVVVETPEESKEKDVKEKK